MPSPYPPVRVGLAVVVGDDLSALMLDTPAVVIARDYEDSVHSHTIPTVGATRNLRLSEPDER